MNAYSAKIMAGNILVPDVESYTKSAVFSLGKTSETTGYWSHGIQVRKNILRSTYMHLNPCAFSMEP